MSVQKIEEAEYAGKIDPIIRIHIKEKWAPILIDEYYADMITIWWDCGADLYDTSIKLYAVEFTSEGPDKIRKVKSWNEPNIKEAMRYVVENIG